MKPFPSWSQKGPLLRVAVIMACLWISSFLLVRYQCKLYIVNGVYHGYLFWAKVILTMMLMVVFMAVAMVCNVRLRKKDGDRLP